MSCAPGKPTYRLLDGLIGWHAAKTTGDPLDGLEDEGGLRLKDPHALEVTAEALTPYLPPSWLARGCGPCTWFLLGPDTAPALWMRDPCPSAGWIDLTKRLVLDETPTKPFAVATYNSWLALTDAQLHCVFVWSIPDGRLVGKIAVQEPGPITFAPWGGLLIVSSGRILRRFSVTGEAHGEPLVIDAPIQRLGRGTDGAAYAACSTNADGPFRVQRITLESAIAADSFAPPCESPRKLAVKPDDQQAWVKALPRTGLIVANERGFCIEEMGEDGALIQRCFTRNGATLRAEEVVPSTNSTTTRTALLETTWLDSGIHRCRWHRVRVDADLSAGTAVKIRVAARECEPGSTVLPENEDWETLPALDALIQKQPAGRCLRVQVELRGGAATTPIVRRVRLDFPRASSMERLPPVYRDNPIAEDFTERFLSLFDASMEDTDSAVEWFARLLSAERAPREVLPWLASLFGIELDPAWEESRSRAVLAALPTLYAERGTVVGLTRAIQLLFDVAPAILEQAATRPWGAVGSARLRGVRLFGKATSRFRLGHASLGRSALVRFGNPELDPFRNVAHRFTVLVLPLTLPAPDAAAQLERLIQRQKPAHTQHVLRLGGDGFLVGRQAAVGIDSVFVPPARAVLGVRRAPGQPGTARLNHRTALYPGSRRRRRGLEIGQALVGMSTVLE